MNTQVEKARHGENIGQTYKRRTNLGIWTSVGPFSTEKMTADFAPPSVLDTKWRQNPNGHFFCQWKFPLQKIHFYTAVGIVFFLLFLKRILCPVSVFGGGAFWPPTALLGEDLHGCAVATDCWTTQVQRVRGVWQACRVGKFTSTFLYLWTLEMRLWPPLSGFQRREGLERWVGG